MLAGRHAGLEQADRPVRWRRYSIDGKGEGWFTDDTPVRFEEYGWKVIRTVDGHDVAATKTASKPTLICCKTISGKGSPKLQGGDKECGAALGDKEVPAVREYIGWDAAPFDMSADVCAGEDSKKQGALLEADWNECFGAYRREFSQQATELTRRMWGVLPHIFEVALSAAIASCVEKKENIATGKASQNAIQALASSLPELLGSLADTTGLNLTNWKERVAVRSGQPGNHILTRQ